jgi:hypothetical protein
MRRGKPGPPPPPDLPAKGEYPIKLGTMLVTMVEPNQGHEVEYNRWYEHDHFYAGCMIGRYNFAGDRFVATRRMKGLRSTTPNDITPDPMTGSYVAIYWVLDGHHDEWNEWSVEQVTWLHQNGRMFKERKHIHTVLYHYEWSARRTPNGTPIEMALDRGYRGIVMVIGELSDGVSHQQMGAWWREQYLPDAFQRAGGPDLMAYATPMPLLAEAPPDVPRMANTDRRFLALHFLDHDPEQGWGEVYGLLTSALNGSGLAKHIWTGPFIQTVFGTDTYTDELR